MVMSIPGSIDAMLKGSDAMLSRSTPICSCDVPTQQQEVLASYSRSRWSKDLGDDARVVWVVPMTGPEYRVTR